MTTRNSWPLMYCCANTLRQSIWRKYRIDWRSCSWGTTKGRFLILIHGEDNMKIMGLLIICLRFCSSSCLRSARIQLSQCMILGQGLLSSPTAPPELSLRTPSFRYSSCLTARTSHHRWWSLPRHSWRGQESAWFCWIFQFWGGLCCMVNLRI